MTDRDAILRNILEEPANDNHRLFAAWCEDDGGDPARAEFIRVQVELARTLEPELKTVRAIDPTKRQQDGEICIRCSDESECRYHELRRRERKMKTPRNMAKWFPTVPILGANLKRGFISSIRCSWSDWLRHHAAIYWHPEQTVECPKCEGRGKDAYVVGAFGPFPNGCPHCSGGRIPRPFVATAQPLELVRLTTWPDPIALNDTRPADTIYTIDRTFDRVNCPTCDGRGYNRRTDVYVDGVRQYNDAPGNTVECPQCHGTTPNRWTCDKWKGLEFEMPEAR